MSVYRTLDEGPVSEISVHRQSIRRKGNDPRVASGAPSDRFAHMRKSNPAAEPLPVTFRWVACLPPAVQPLGLLRRYPRIANALALEWRERNAFRTRLYELLVDRRGDRQGFPPDVQSELLRLREYFDTNCYPLRGR
jgi:hypothetical protein